MRLRDRLWIVALFLAVASLALAAGGSHTLFDNALAPSGVALKNVQPGLDAKAPFINVRAAPYFAACNGSTDVNDSTALTAAIAACGSGDCTIYLPAGCIFDTSFNVANTVRLIFNGAPGGVGTFSYNGDYWYPHHFRMQDSAPFANAMLELDHISTISNEYGIDIQNYSDSVATPTPGAGAQIALAIHQYSDRAPAVQIDNIRSAPAIRFKNTLNNAQALGTLGSGDYFNFWGFTTGSPGTAVDIGSLNNLLAFISRDSSRPWTFSSATTGASLVVQQTNAGTGLNIQQTGAGNAISVAQSGAAHGVVITPAVGADGFFPLTVPGRKNGANFSISQDAAGNNAITVAKNGTGAGDGIYIVNKGTGYGIRIQNATPADVWKIDINGKITVATGGAADTAGRAVLVAGTKTVSTTAVTAASVIMLTNCVGGGTIGLPQVGTVVAGTSFVINSVQPGTASTLQGADTSTICWSLIN